MHAFCRNITCKWIQWQSVIKQPKNSHHTKTSSYQMILCQILLTPKPPCKYLILLISNSPHTKTSSYQNLLLPNFLFFKFQILIIPKHTHTKLFIPNPAHTKFNSCQNLLIPKFPNFKSSWYQSLLKPNSPHTKKLTSIIPIFLIPKSPDLPQYDETDLNKSQKTGPKTPTEFRIQVQNYYTVWNPTNSEISCFSTAHMGTLICYT